MSSSKKILNSDFNLDLDESVQVDDEHMSMEQKLANLWARAKITFVAVTDEQKYFEGLNGIPEPGITPAAAVVAFRKLLIEYKSKEKETNLIERLNMTDNLIISPDRVQSSTGVYTFQQGEIIDPHSPPTVYSTCSREVANILVMYTKLGENNKAIPYAEPKQYKDAMLPYISLCRIRDTMKAYDTDVIKARDDIQRKLAQKDRLFLLIGIMSYILKGSDMENFRTERPDLLAKYQAAKGDKPYYPTCEKIYMFKSHMLLNVTLDNVDDAWMYKHRCTAVRGVDKRVGVLSSGYYTYSISPYQDATYAKFYDVYSAAKHLGVSAVELQGPDHMLAYLLVANGISVYCPSMTPVSEPEPVLKTCVQLRKEEDESDKKRKKKIN